VGLPLFLLNAIYLFSLPFSQLSARGFEVTGQLVLVSCFFLGVLLSRWTRGGLDVLAVLLAGLVSVNLALWVANGFPMLFTGIYQHKNSLGGITGFSLVLIACAQSVTPSVAKRVAYGIALMAGILVVIAATNRSVWLSLLVILATYGAWPWFSRRRWRFYSVLVIVLLGMGGLVLFYVVGRDLPILRAAQRFVLLYTTANLYSGREVLWSDLMPLILERPWFGYGAGTTPGQLLNTDLSSHNLYLQVLLQVGFVGLAVLIWCFVRLWGTFYAGASDRLVRVVGCAFLGIVVHQMFEVSLTQNNVSLGLLLWLILGLGVSRVLDVTSSSRELTVRRETA
jgi:O-antigen ligase